MLGSRPYPKHSFIFDLGDQTRCAFLTCFKKSCIPQVLRLWKMNPILGTILFGGREKTRKWFCRTFPSSACVARRRTTIGASHLHNPGGWLEGRWRGFPPQLLFPASRSEAVGLAPSSGDGGSPPSMGCLATCLLLGGRDPSRLMLGGGGAVAGRLLAAAC
jgi:hypothetical protein